MSNQVAGRNNAVGNRRSAYNRAMSALTSSTGRKLVQAGINQMWKAAKKRSASQKRDPVKGTMIVSGGSGRKLKLSNKRRKRVAKAPITDRVQKLEKQLKKSLAHHVYKLGYSKALKTEIGICDYDELNLVGASRFDTMLASLPRVDYAAPGTKTTWNATTTAQPTTWNIKTFTKLNFRNNYNYPCNLRVYIVKPKQDCSISPLSAFSSTAGLQKQATPGYDNVFDPWIFPTDSQQFNDIWAIIETKIVQLQTGDEIDVTLAEDFVYDQEIPDNNADTWLKKYSRACLFRIQGVTCHDSATDADVSTSPAGVDVLGYLKMTLARDSEAPILTFHETRGILQTYTGTPVVGVQSAEKETAI